MELYQLALLSDDDDLIFNKVYDEAIAQFSPPETGREHTFESTSENTIHHRSIADIEDLPELQFKEACKRVRVSDIASIHYCEAQMVLEKVTRIKRTTTNAMAIGILLCHDCFMFLLVVSLKHVKPAPTATATDIDRNPLRREGNTQEARIRSQRSRNPSRYYIKGRFMGFEVA